jgi:hypothetical protein
MGKLVNLSKGVESTMKCALVFLTVVKLHTITILLGRSPSTRRRRGSC